MFAGDVYRLAAFGGCRLQTPTTMKAVDGHQQQCAGNIVFPTSITDDSNMVPKNDDIKQPNNNNNNNESMVVVNGKVAPVLNGHDDVEPSIIVNGGVSGGDGVVVKNGVSTTSAGKLLVRSSLNIDLVTNGHYTVKKSSAPDEDVDDTDENCSNNKNSLESLTDIDVGEQTVRPLNGTTPPENIPRVSNAGYDGLQVDSGLESAASSWDRTVAEVKEHAFARLQEELRKAHQELKLKDEEVTRLSRIRGEVEAELEDLTASLFQVSTVPYISLCYICCNVYCFEL